MAGSLGPGAGPGTRRAGAASGRARGLRRRVDRRSRSVPMLTSVERVLVTGASGFVGGRLVRRLAREGSRVVAWSGRHPERIPGLPGVETRSVDLGDASAIVRALAAAAPEAVVHAAAVSSLARCERQPELAARVNQRATELLAEACAARGARLVFCSTDQVFDGSRGGWAEGDAPRPLHVYGRSKLAAEAAVAALGGLGTRLRLALVYGDSPAGARSFHEQIRAALEAGTPLRLFEDEFRSPLHVDDVVQAILELLPRRDRPLLHLGGPERVSRLEMGQAAARRFGWPASRIEPARLAERSDPVPRPADLSLDTRLARSSLRRPPRSLAAGLADLARPG